MFSAAITKIVDHSRRVREAADRAARRVFAKAAFRIMRDAQSSVVRSAKPSSPGDPPHTKRGQLRRAIRYSATKDGAVIGPLASMVGVSAEAHEFGGAYKGQSFPERPFMGPALERDLDNFAGDFAGSITQ
jgi:phage gpG-like protein